MNLFCVGLSHHTANIETRERFAGHPGTNSVLRNSGCSEALVLSTCNRVEVYAAAPLRVPTEAVARCLARGIDERLFDDISPFYRYDDDDCAYHIFRVAAGIDSMVVGETEILGQAKKAYESARSSGAAGPFLHRLFQRAFRVAKQVRTHTQITRGSVSVGSVAVDLAQKIFGDLAGRKVLVLGAGETSERTARALASRGVTDLRVSNRSADRAEEVARSVGGWAVPFDLWLKQCGEIDILVTSTSSDSPLLSTAALEPILRERIDRPLFIIDIAVPRNVDPKINELRGVYVYDIDSLQSVAEQSLALRRQQIVAAEEIIAAHVADFREILGRRFNHRSEAPEHSRLGEASLRTSES
jgi:glutamyl-tRNA reductase